LSLLPLAATDLASGRLVVPFAPRIVALRDWLLTEAQHGQ
jgi:hypothetical protein